MTRGLSLSSHILDLIGLYPVIVMGSGSKESDVVKTELEEQGMS